MQLLSIFLISGEWINSPSLRNSTKQNQKKGDFMKKLIFAALISALALPALASTTVRGFGLAQSDSAPICDKSAYLTAEIEADKNAAIQCQSAVLRIGKYALDCKQAAHGRTAVAVAAADYNCDPQN
jgi:hypothetical protein